MDEAGLDGTTVMPSARVGACPEVAVCSAKKVTTASRIAETMLMRRTEKDMASLPSFVWLIPSDVFRCLAGGVSRPVRHTFSDPGVDGKTLRLSLSGLAGTVHAG
jgi:hypothetical protein